MSGTTIASNASIDKRMAIVQAHIAAENAHDTAATLATWSVTECCFIDAAAGVVAATPRDVWEAYTGLFSAFPDLRVECQTSFVAQEVIVIEATMTGTHRNEWQGLRATQKVMSVPVCALFYFNAADELTCEKIFYDRLTLMEQLGAVDAT
jgi:steroid delta-isomerase-like uncharacterized protein